MKKQNYKKHEIVNNVMKKLLLVFVFSLFLISFVSADYRGQIVNTDLSFSVTSNNATSCQVTTANYPNGILNIYQTMSQTGQTFDAIITAGNFTTLGDYCFNIVCTDGLTNEDGSYCVTVSPSGKVGNSNLMLFAIVILIIYAISFIGFFGKNMWVSILGGLGMIALGIYTINNGIVIYKDFITNIFSWTTIGIGAIFALVAGVELIQDNL